MILSSSRLLMLLALTTTTMGCDSLDRIQYRVCGNHLVEDQETCDGDPESGCIPPHQINECHMRCSFYAGGICPKGQACSDNGACLVKDNLCGNGVTEPGDNETCDGEPDCIPPGKPDACHLKCSHYDKGICPMGSKCSSNGACLPELNVCGNGVVEAPEECDGSSDCIPAGGPDECKLRCEAHVDGHCPAKSICDSYDACVLAPGVCGNLWLDPGEECDGDPGCGPPGTSAACKYSCLNGASCPAGKSCDQDYICRTGLIHVGDITIAKAADVSLIAGVAILEGSLLVNAPDLTTLDLPNLESIRDNFTIDQNSGLVSARLPNLATIGGNLTVCPRDVFDELDLSGLTQAGAIGFASAKPGSNCQWGRGWPGTPYFMPKLSKVSLGHLSSVVGNFSVGLTHMPGLPPMPNLTTIGGGFQISETQFTEFGGDYSSSGWGALRSVGSVYITSNKNLARVRFWGLQNAGNIYIGSNASLVDINLGSLQNAADVNISDNNANSGPLFNVSMGNVHIRNNLTLSGNTNFVSVDLVSTVVDGTFTLSGSGAFSLSTPSGANQIFIKDNLYLSSIDLWINLPTLQWLQVTNNPQLREIRDEAHFTYVRYLDIESNNLLGALTLPYLDTVQSLTVVSNPSMPTCAVKALANSLRQMPPPQITIANNNDNAVCH
jgi:hypothetical protein